MYPFSSNHQTQYKYLYKFTADEIAKILGNSEVQNDENLNTENIQKLQIKLPAKSEG